jgi:hypothetical protein
MQTELKPAAGTSIDLAVELVTRPVVGQAAGETVSAREQLVQRSRVRQVGGQASSR